MNLSEEALVSISEASRILGVSEPALRQWTDEGKIKAFVTPGGHRRYSKAELKRFMGSHQKTLGIKDFALQLEDTVPVHREIDRAFLNTSWSANFDEKSQEQLSTLGRRLLDLIIRYVTEPAKREETIQQAHDVGRSFGQTLSELGLPLTDSVEAFLRHRGPIMSVTTNLMRQKEAFNGRAAAAIPLADRVIDEALVSLVAAHQAHRNSFSPPKTGDMA